MTGRSAAAPDLWPRRGAVYSPLARGRAQRQVPRPDVTPDANSRAGRQGQAHSGKPEMASGIPCALLSRFQQYTQGARRSRAWSNLRLAWVLNNRRR